MSNGFKFSVSYGYSSLLSVFSRLCDPEYYSLPHVESD